MLSKKNGLLSNPLQHSRRFCLEDRGAVAIYVGLTSVVMLGFGALVVDGGRLFTVHTELQNAADAAALAGAAELDGNTDAITRACAAAQGEIFKNSQSFYNEGSLSRTVDFPTGSCPNDNIKFLHELPSLDDDPSDPLGDYVTSDPTAARFIWVTTPNRNVGYLIAPVLKFAVGGDGTGPVSGIAKAEAVAGMNSVTCKVPPLMICNPAEATGGVGAPFTPVVGQQVLLKQGGSGFWGPGAFGMLRFPASDDATDGKTDNASNGARAFAEGIASGVSTGCYSSMVQVEGGQATGPVADGVNVRFDIYPNGGLLGGNPSGNSKYKPALNVTKGKYKSGNAWENYTDPTKGLPLPISTCFDGGARFCSPMSASDASTTLSTYFSTFHPSYTLDQALIDQIDAAVDGVADGTVTLNEIFEWENANHIPDKTGVNAASNANAENGKPKNYSGSDTPSADRRTVQVAVVNCLEHNLQGGGSATYPVEAFLNMFLVRPVSDPSDNSLYVELQKELEPGVDDALHDVVQLYR